MSDKVASEKDAGDNAADVGVEDQSTSGSTESHLDEYIDKVITDTEERHPLHRFFRIPTLLSEDTSTSGGFWQPADRLLASIIGQRQRRSRDGSMSQEGTRTNDSEDHDEDEDDTVQWDYETVLSAPVVFNGTIVDRQTGVLRAFAPDTFADLRSRFGVLESQFRRAISESDGFVSFQSNSKGAARVGGIFFFTQDGAYMIKTIKVRVVRSPEFLMPTRLDNVDIVWLCLKKIPCVRS